MIVEYSEEVVVGMCAFYNSLTEKDRRRYAAIEAKKLGYGRIVYLATLFKCDEKTIKKGLSELEDEDYMKQVRIRSEGGGVCSQADVMNSTNSRGNFLSSLLLSCGRKPSIRLFLP